MKNLQSINNIAYHFVSYFTPQIPKILLGFITTGFLLSSQSVNAQTDDNVAQKVSNFAVLPAIKCSVKIIETDNSAYDIPCNSLVITVGGNAINYHYDWMENNQAKYGVSFMAIKESYFNLFGMMTHSKDSEAPMVADAEGSCQKTRINTKVDQLSCSGITPTGNKFIGNISVKSFDVTKIISDLNSN